MTRAALLCLALSGAACWGGLPSAARAQAESADGGEARALFERARDAIRLGRFAEARDLLRRSLASQPRRAAAFNLGVALRGTGEVRESVAVFRSLLRGEYGPVEGDQRAQVESLLEEVRADLARIRVEACGAERVEVRVDGALRTTLGRCGEESLEVDPGAHVVRFDATRADPVERRVSLDRGETASVVAALVVRPPPEANEPELLPWILGGVGLLAVAAVAVGLVFVFDPLNEPHVQDPVYGEIEALAVSF